MTEQRGGGVPSGSSSFSSLFQRITNPFRRNPQQEQGPPLPPPKLPGPPMPTAGNVSPIPQRRPRSSAITDDSFGRPRSGAFIGDFPPFASTPREQSVFGNRPTPPVPFPRTRDMLNQPLRRERAGAVSTNPFIPPTNPFNPFTQGSPQRQERSPSPQPQRRPRSTAVSSDVFSRRRTSAISGPQPPTPSGAQGESGSPIFRRQRSSAITGQPTGRTQGMPNLGEDSEDSQSIAGVQAHEQYLQYIRNRQRAATNPFSAYSGYNPFLPLGPHQPYGEGPRGQRRYPYPSSSSLGQEQSGYTQRHPSEENLPQAQGKRAAHGEHGGLPVQGPGTWQQYFGKWSDLGPQHGQDIPRDEPLTDDEQKFLEKYGFSFEQQLGRGSYGTVWLVLTTRLFTEPVPEGDPIKYVPKRLACKVLSLKKFESPTESVEAAVKKLVREADLHQTLNHRNIVKCEHVFHVHDQVTGFPFVRLLMFMELCDGDLKQLLTQQKKFHERQAMDMMNDVCDALQYLHDQNICHFDIKIHNIMYSKEGGDHICYKLADFGVSKKYVSENVARIYGAQGTRSYMAPELMRMPKGMSESKPADIYSLGCVFAEVLTGRAKFKQLFKDLKEKGLTPEVFGKWQLGLLCTQLIWKMTDENPRNRPTIAQVRQDPWFASN